MRSIVCALPIAVALATILPAAQSPTAADAFAAKLKSAIDAHDRAGVAALVSFPITVMVSGFRLPFENASVFTKSYDALFTPSFRCRVSNAIRNREFSTSADGMTIAGSAIYAARKGGELKITRMLVPGSAPPPALPVLRRVDFAGRPTAQFLGRLERDDYDRFLLNARSRQKLDVTITGFPGRSFAIRVLDDRTGAPVPTSLHTGPRTWSGIVPATGSYRVEIQRLAPYCDPALQYELTLTLG